MNKITQRTLAKEMGITEEYVSMVFNGIKNPKCAEEKFTNAVESILAKTTVQ